MRLVAFFSLFSKIRGAKKASDFDHDLENYNTLVEFLIKNVKKGELVFHNLPDL